MAANARFRGIHATENTKRTNIDVKERVLPPSFQICTHTLRGKHNCRKAIYGLERKDSADNSNDHAATTDAQAGARPSKQTPAPNSLLGLPSELRLYILDHIFTTNGEMWPLRPGFHVYGEVTLYPFRPRPGHENEAAVLRTNRLLYDEGSEVLYRNAKIELTITNYISQPPDIMPPSLGLVENVKFWPLLRHIKLNVTFAAKEGGRNVASRILAIVKALEKGRWLRSLKIKIDWEEGRPMPADFDDAIAALFQLSMPREKVIVEVNGDMEEEESWQVKIDILDAIDSKDPTQQQIVADYESHQEYQEQNRYRVQDSANPSPTAPDHNPVDVEPSDKEGDVFLRKDLMAALSTSQSKQPRHDLSRSQVERYAEFELAWSRRKDFDTPTEEY